MVPTAPGLFSTMTFQPSPSESALAMMRAMMSGGVLAEYGTTIRMTFEGKDWPNVVSWAARLRPLAAAPVRNARRFMAFARSCGLPGCRSLFDIRERNEG